MARKHIGPDSAETLPASESSSPSPTLSASLSDQAPFRLFDLPDELVLLVLEMAVVQSTKADPIKVDRAVKSKKSPTGATSSGINYRKGAEPLIQPAITRVCRAIRQEALPMFYKLNIFYTHNNRHSLRTMMRWFDGIGQANVANIRQLFVAMFDVTSCTCSFICTCLLVVMKRLGDGLRDDSYTRSVRVLGHRVVLEHVAGSTAFQISPNGIGNKRGDEVWKSAKEWADKSFYEGIGLGAWTVVR